MIYSKNCVLHASMQYWLEMGHTKDSPHAGANATIWEVRYPSCFFKWNWHITLGCGWVQGRIIKISTWSNPQQTSPVWLVLCWNMWRETVRLYPRFSVIIYIYIRGFPGSCEIIALYLPSVAAWIGDSLEVWQPWCSCVDRRLLGSVAAMGVMRKESVILNLAQLGAPKAPAFVLVESPYDMQKRFPKDPACGYYSD